MSLSSSRITQSQLESYLWGAATLLRGLIDAGDYKQFIFPLLFFKRLCDVYDEEYERALAESGGDVDYAAFAENHRFQIPAGAHWRDVRAVTTHVGQALQNALRAIEQANQGQLYGIFGDAQWTNKERLSDATLRDLVEHFSSLTLSVANVPEDELGNAYEYLIKKFADDSGHTAAEFYTNRTVVQLMTRLLDPQEEESIYDPTAGSGGMLLSAAMQLKRQGKEWRTLRLYGQERNLITSAIARMNLFLHGFEDFRVERGDTLADPKLLEGDSLRRFDPVVAIRDVQPIDSTERFDDGLVLGCGNLPDFVAHIVRCRDVEEWCARDHASHHGINRLRGAIGQEHRTGLSSDRCHVTRAIVFLIRPGLFVLLDEVALVFV